MLHDQILRGAHEAERDPGDITLAYNMEIRIDEHATPESGAVTGSPDAVIERLIGFTELGFTAMNFQPIGPGREEQIERLATEAIPAVREAL